jgi:hypothetical protein
MEEIPNGDGGRLLSDPTPLSRIIDAHVGKEKDHVKRRRDQDHREREHGLVVALAGDEGQHYPGDDAWECQHEMPRVAQNRPIGRLHYHRAYAQGDARLDAEIPDESQVTLGGRSQK